MGQVTIVVSLIWSGLAAADVSDIKNFHEVGTHLYRGARPGAAGLRTLAAVGVRTIINLDNDKSANAGEKVIAESLGLKYISIPMSGFWRPKDPQVIKALSAIGSPANWPIYVHCKHGEDRTGLVIGLYRVFTEKWTPALAWAEMLRLGFHPLLLLITDYFRDTVIRPDFWPAA